MYFFVRVRRLTSSLTAAPPGRTRLPASGKPPSVAGKNEQPRTEPCRTSSLDTSEHLHRASTQHSTTRPTTPRLGKTTKSNRRTRPHLQSATITLITQPGSVLVL